MRDVPYKAFKKTKCEVCESVQALTVHHIIGTEFHEYLVPPYTVVPKDLVTLCKECHDELESEIGYCIKNKLQVDPVYQAKCLLLNDYITIKPFKLNPQKTKGKPAAALIQRVEAAFLIMYGKPIDWTKDAKIDIGKRWGNLTLDNDKFCKMLRTYYRSFKQRKQL